jgi:pimeloyl-ACP methyl ester carboxylesterase
MLLLHGSGPEPRTEPPTRAVINTLVRSGIAVLVYDKRGVGASGGDFDAAGYGDFIDDAVAAVEYLARRPDVDGSRIGLYTVSESGWFGPEIVFKTQKVSLMFNKVAAPFSVAETVIWEVRNDYLAGGVPASEVQALVDNATRRWAYYRDAATNPGLAKGSERDAINAQLSTLRDGVPGAAELLPPELLAYDAERYAEIAAAQFYDPSPFLLEIDIPLYYAYGEEDINMPTRRCIEALEVLIHEHGKDIEYTVYPGLGHSLASWRGILQIGWAPGYLDRLAVWTVKQMQGN